MAQTITIAGTSYPDVPSLEIPKSGGGTASYVDTSDADATAEDILSGKTAYVDGVKVTGTGSGGGGSSSKYGITLDNCFGDVNASDVLQQPTGGNVDLTVSGFKKMVTYAFYYRFQRNLALRSVAFPDLEALDTAYAMQYAFTNCTNITSASFPKLASVAASSAMANCFYGCSNLTSASFPLLATVTSASSMQYVFYNCSKLETLSFPSLTRIGPTSSTSTNNRHFYYAFNGCTKLTSLSFPELTAIYCNGNGTSYGTFANNNKLQKIYFPKLTYIGATSNYTNANKNMPIENLFTGCTSLTEIHFALTNKTAIEALVGYSSAWGSSATIYFDL